MIHMFESCISDVALIISKVLLLGQPSRVDLTWTEDMV